MLCTLQRALPRPLSAVPALVKISKYFKSEKAPQRRSSAKVPASDRKSPKNMATSLDEAQIERMARNFSKWRPVSNQPTIARPSETDFSIMSFNILAQENLDNHPKLYQKHASEIIQWNYRRERVLKQLLQQNCDILCLQEVQADHLEDFLGPRLAEAGYQYIFKCKTGGKAEGCAIFWKTAVFGIQTYSLVEMLAPGCRILNRDNVGLVAVLVPVANRGARLCVATTHLLFNPKRGEVKLAQLRLLMAQVEKCAFLGVSSATKKPMYIPTIICGDLNATPRCPLYNFIVSGQLEVDGLLHGAIVGNHGGDYIRPEELHVGGLLPNTLHEATFIERFGEQALNTLQYAFDRNLVFHTLGPFRSCYGHSKKNLPEISTSADLAATVDYIFFQPTKLLRHIATLDLMTESEVASLGGIPNAAMGSDHLPLASRFFLKEMPPDYLSH